jgi:hypothetical protein
MRPLKAYGAPTFTSSRAATLSKRDVTLPSVAETVTR